MRARSKQRLGGRVRPALRCWPRADWGQARAVLSLDAADMSGVHNTDFASNGEVHKVRPRCPSVCPCIYTAPLIVSSKAAMEGRVESFILWCFTALHASTYQHNVTWNVHACCVRTLGCRVHAALPRLSRGGVDPGCRCGFG